MTLRVAKLTMIFAVAVYYTLLVFNNVTDYNSNYQFVRHVLMMDSTYPGNRGMWRALNQPTWHTFAYVFIIAWEVVTTLLCWWGALQMTKALHASVAEFHRAKRIAIVALTLSLLMWFVAFLDVGGEWFLMWQSRLWNGQDKAFHMFTVIGIVLLLAAQPETEERP
jgi:predicted small integral membrane protein